MAALAGPVNNRQSMKLRWRNKLLIAFVIFAIVPAALVALLAFETFQNTSSKASLASMEGLVRAKAAAIDEFTVSRKLDVQRLAGILAKPVANLRLAEEEAALPPAKAPEQETLPRLDDAGRIPEDDTETPVPDATPEDRILEEAPVEPEPQVRDPIANEVLLHAQSEVKRTLGLLLGEQATFEELLVIALDGRVVASTFGEHAGKTAEDVEYFKRGRAATYVQGVFISPITQELTMVIATPIRDANNEELGVLAARLNLKRFFRLINDNTGLGVSGETQVGRIIDDHVVLMAPTRSNPDAALNRKVAITDSRRPIVAAARGETAARKTVDSNNQKVFAAWTFVPSLEWGIVTKINVEEATQPLVGIQKRLIGITLGVMGFAFVASLIFATALVKPVSDLKNAAEKISKGDFDVELDIRPGDELGELADSFERMVAAIKFFRNPGEDVPEEGGGSSPEDPDTSRPATRA